jgi:hypothetical protein
MPTRGLKGEVETEGKIPFLRSRRGTPHSMSDRRTVVAGRNLYTVAGTLQSGLQEEAKNDGAVAGRGLSEVCYGTKYLYAMKKDPGAAILPVISLPTLLS